MEQRPLTKKQKLWLVLALAVLLVSVIAGQRCGQPAGKGGAQRAVTADGAGLRAEISRVEAVRDGEHVHLILTGKFTAEGTGPVRLESPAVRLLTPDGREVARFIAPFLPEPAVTGGTPAEVALHWWLPVADAAGALTLDVSGARVPVKDSSAFSVDSLPNGQTVPLRFPAWRPAADPSS